MILVDPNNHVNGAKNFDPRIMVYNLKIYCFDIRIVKIYSPREVEASDLKKDTFHCLLQKACIKTEKHEELIIEGNFKEKISNALR